MNEQAIREIMEERCQNSNTASAYQSVYRSMREFEKKTGRCFEDSPVDMLFEYVAQKQYKSVVMINTQLLYIRHYLEKVGCGDKVRDISSRDFDISAAMKAAYVGSIEELYNRCKLVYDPDNGEAVYPYVSFAWMGIPQTEAKSLPENAVHLDTGRIDTSTQLIFDTMPELMIEILTKFQNATQSTKGNGQIKLPDRVGAFIYKTSHAGSSSAGKLIALGTANDLLAKVREAYKETYHQTITTTFKDIEKSARYYKARKMELAGADWDDVANSALLQQVFGSNRIEPVYLRHNYHMYKKAFRLE